MANALEQNELEMLGRAAALNATVQPEKAVEIVKTLLMAAAASSGPVEFQIELKTKNNSSTGSAALGLPCLACACISGPFGIKICHCVVPPGGEGCG